MALVLPSIPEYLVAYLAAAKVGAITAGVNARLSPPERAACSRSPTPRWCWPRPTSRRRRAGEVVEVRAGGRAPTTCSRTLRTARRGAAAVVADDPDGRSPSSSRRARPARPRARCSATASWRPSPPSTSATGGAGRRALARGHVARPPRPHDQAGRQPAPGRHRVPDPPLAGRRGAAPHRRAPHDAASAASPPRWR